MSVSPPPAPLRSAMKHSSSTASEFPFSTSPPDSPMIYRPFAQSRPSTSSTLTSTSTSTGSSYTTMAATPPPPPTMSPATSMQGYTPKVSFDTFENSAATMFSFTLGVKNEGYTRTRSTRVFLCAASADESGREALDWALESLVQDGDELIVCRGFDQEELLSKDHDVVREEAREFMRQIQEKCAVYDNERKVSIILEYVTGRITDTLDRLIALYRPDSVVVGMRGRKSWQNIGAFGMGSVSKYCLTHSPVPIIVVRPERKLRKAVEKRRADPKRGKHFEE